MSADELASALAAVLGEPVGELRRLSAGASRETWAFTAGERRLVLRRDPPGVPRPVEMAREAECFRAAAAAGVPVPPLVATGAGDDPVGTPYLLMEWLDGETLAPRILRDERWAAVRSRLARELGRVLARIHGVDLADVGSLEHVPDRLAALREQHDAFAEARPVLELAFRWLAAHRPAPVAPALVHGDFRNGNLMVGPDGLAAVLDWELAHVGDPREDLGWACTRAWRFGAAAPVGGFGGRDELLDGYAEVAGVRPDPEAVAWWEVFGCVHWAVICRVQCQRHLTGGESSVELAVLGRRAVEAEYDTLLALGLVDSAEPADPLATPPSPPSPAADRPTVDELLAAVAGFLTDDLVAGDARTAYLAKVARTAVTVVRRELRSPAQVTAADDALAAGIRSGALDPADPDVVAAVRAGTLARLAVANPRYPATRA